MKTSKRLLSTLIVIFLAISIFTGCKGRDEASSSGSSSSGTSSSKGTSSESPKTDGEPVSKLISDMVGEVVAKKAENSDTVGWLQVPEFGLDDVVVCDFTSNQTYYRANFKKEYEFNGIFYADKRSVFGDGSVDQLGVNTCIYGHSMTDDPESKRYNVMFGPLAGLRDPEIAKTVPYLFFSTEKENLVFEIFAVFVANMDNPDVPYNRNDIAPAEFRKMVKEQILPRSLYNYDVQLKDDDKFLTLSTCIYTLPNGQKTGYPDTYYRYGIMARLVSPDEPRKLEASFTINENPLLDSDGHMVTPPSK